MPLPFGTSASLIGHTNERPAADPQQIGRTFADIDTGLLYRDNGATWDIVARASTATHGHAESDVTDLTSDLSDKAAADHTHTTVPPALTILIAANYI